jgi:C-terminal processing protease CtpA/Prc
LARSVWNRLLAASDRTRTARSGAIGLTLKKQGGAYFVAGITTRKGKPTVEGVEPGDKLVQIDGNKTKGASLGTIFTALHGKPGEIRILTLERHGTEINIHAKITAF